MLNVKQVNKIYESKVSYQALTDISFEVNQGEFVSIMGPSGSGKTTLLNMIATLDTLTSGEVSINGKNPQHLKKDKLASFRRTELGFIFQNFHLLETLTVGENIALPLMLEKEPVSVIEQKLDETLKTLGMFEHQHKRTYEISGGQSQRTAIGRALITNPGLILADEPTGNLDSAASQDVLELLATLNKKEEATILMVTHDPIAASYSDRVIFLKDGEIFNEIYQSGNQNDYYTQIIHVLLHLGGGRDDLSSVRLP